MSTWVNEHCVSFFQLFCIRVVKTGRIPQHIAFIMDGNRRYAKKYSVNCATGHSKGFDKLSETLRVCIGGKCLVKPTTLRHVILFI